MDSTEIERTVEQRRTRQARRRARTSRQLSTLLERREELTGVVPAADFVVESVRWTA